MPLLYSQSVSMVRKLGANSWLTALKRMFRYPSKDSNSGRKNRQCKRDEEEEKQKREKGRRWLFSKAAADENSVETAGVEIISRTPPPSRRLLCAATVIQTAFRCYLAKRALVALKGIVKLQALIRGQNVRRQARITLKCMQALFRVQERMREQCARISQDSTRKSMFSDSWESKYIRERKSIFRDHCSVSDAWRECPPTLQELEVMLQAQKAAFMRERCPSQSCVLMFPECFKAWSSDTDVVDGEEREKTPLKQGKSRASALPRRNPVKSGEINVRIRSLQNKSASSVQAPATPSPAKPKPVQLRPTTSPGNLEKSQSTANTPRLCPTNRSASFAPRYSVSGISPGYMAATESAKARLRSQSAPRQRPATPAKRCLSYSVSKNGEEEGMEKRLDYWCNAESVGGEISPCSTGNSRWWSRR
ncbi:protein IQ-DOMAIN 14-like isoform X1 [Ipomoea triloba]|uniref:protein IQ-DOMAIN 14-like isoform X1 n=1 Tax=Ipomoea triloba TaxID=35885 RepID=UPI00125E8CE2|nr:protein IQ-DOMAIN 14-like isoform X1 [Ipomoea triloba]